MDTTYDDFAIDDYALGSETDEYAHERCSKRWSASELERVLEAFNLLPPARHTFLGLPAEIRLRIYDYLPAPSVPSSATADNTVLEHAFAILHVSRQVNAEAKPILYGNIEVDSTYLKHLPVHAVDYIGTVRILCRYTLRDNGSGTWTCEPALRLFNPGNDWTLEGMYRYLGRAFPSIRNIRLEVGGIPARPKATPMPLSREDAPSTEKEKASVNVLPALQCAVVCSLRGGEVLSAEGQAWRLELSEKLRAEVVRLSRGASVISASKEGWW